MKESTRDRVNLKELYGFGLQGLGSQACQRARDALFRV